jgi:hypothetical protein
LTFSGVRFGKVRLTWLKLNSYWDAFPASDTIRDFEVPGCATGVVDLRPSKLTGSASDLGS